MRNVIITQRETEVLNAHHSQQINNRSERVLFFPATRLLKQHSELIYTKSLRVERIKVCIYA